MGIESSIDEILKETEGHTPGPWILTNYGEDYTTDEHSSRGTFEIESEALGVRNFMGDFKRFVTGSYWGTGRDVELMAAAPKLRNEVIRLRMENSVLKMGMISHKMDAKRPGAN